MPDWKPEFVESMTARLDEDQMERDAQREHDLGLEPGYLADARTARFAVDAALRVFRNEEAELIELAREQERCWGADWFRDAS